MEYNRSIYINQIQYVYELNKNTTKKKKKLKEVEKQEKNGT